MVEWHLMAELVSSATKPATTCACDCVGAP